MKSLLAVFAAGGMMVAATSANATIGTYTSAGTYTTATGGGALGIQDNVDWGQFSLAQNNPTVNNSTVNNGSSMTTGKGELVTATNGAANGFTVYTNGATGGLAGTRWDGMFGSGTNVLATGANSITLSFSGAITGFGIDAQTAAAGAYGFTITASNAAGTVLGSVTNSGVSTGRNTGLTDINTAAFAGITSSAGDISLITITATGAISSGFAIDTSLVFHFPNNQTTGQTQTTPEPGTIALLGAGLAALGAVRRRRNRAA